ncbi:hypothetical protein GCM10028805_52210 [Spirosoma harenae]
MPNELTYQAYETALAHPYPDYAIKNEYARDRLTYQSRRRYEAGLDQLSMNLYRAIDEYGKQKGWERWQVLSALEKGEIRDSVLLASYWASRTVSSIRVHSNSDTEKLLLSLTRFFPTDSEIVPKTTWDYKNDSKVIDCHLPRGGSQIRRRQIAMSLAGQLEVPKGRKFIDRTVEILPDENLVRVTFYPEKTRSDIYESEKWILRKAYEVVLVDHYEWAKGYVMPLFLEPTESSPSLTE